MQSMLSGVYSLRRPNEHCPLGPLMRQGVSLEKCSNGQRHMVGPIMGLQPGDCTSPETFYNEE